MREIIKIENGARQYPPLLNEVANPPKSLYCAGDITLLKSPCIAVVGTRSVTQYGVRAADFFVRELVAAGFTVVSGLARGADSAAHRAALDAGGKTVAVLGCGLNHTYPPENKALADKIAERGLLVSEFPPDTPVAAYNFPVRNRIISGLSRGVLIIEAGEKSGTRNTAAHAAAQGREIFVVPGQIFSPQSRGANALIKEVSGACLVTEPADIFKKLGVEGAAGKAAAEYTPKERRVIELIEREGEAHFDEIAETLGAGVSAALTFLADMELKGYIIKTDGNRYAMC